MNAPSQFLFDGLQLCLHAIPPGLPFHFTFPRRGLPLLTPQLEGEFSFAERRGLRFSTALRADLSCRVFSADATVETPATAFPISSNKRRRRSRSQSQ